MSNHCSEVFCSDCGKIYCLRGCGTDFQYTTSELKEVMKNPHLYEFDSQKGDCCRGAKIYSYSIGLDKWKVG